MIYSENEIQLIMENSPLKQLYIELLELKLKTDLKLGNDQLAALNEFNKSPGTMTKIVPDVF